MKKIIFLSFFLLLLLLFSGCLEQNKNTAKEDNIIANNEIKQVIDELKQTTKAIDISTQKTIKEVDVIKTEAKEIKKITEDISKNPSQSKTNIKKIITSTNIIEEKSNNITQEMIRIDEKTKNIKKETLSLKQSSLILTASVRKINKLEKQRNAAVKKEKDASKKIIQKVMYMCFIGMGISIFIGIVGNPKVGLAGFAACTITLIVAVTFNEHIILISWIGIGLLVLIIAFIAIKMIAQQFKLKHKDKVINETIETTEMAKFVMTQKERDKVFGKKGETGLAGNIQSKKTIKEIKKVKSKMSKIWKIAKDEKKVTDEKKD